MSPSLAWIGDPWDPGAAGLWGPQERLTLPLDDRGLLLADGLFETLQVEGGRAWRLEEHRRRWAATAALLALPPPPSLARLEGLVEEAVCRQGSPSGVLRLNLSRGGGGRGLEPAPSTAAGAGARFWLSYGPGRPRFDPVRLVLSRLETRNAASRLSQCKTFAYGGSLIARREALDRGADDALLASSAGGLCCATAASLLVRLEGCWCTPPLTSGCLPGILRGLALAQGVALERPLDTGDLQRGEGALLINSLGCRPVATFEGRALPSPTPLQAEALWRALLQGGERRPRAAAQLQP
jgi:branched-subunit amino acid aminotransferase/4-amino-4-deoxychorismate lyase